MLLKNDIEEEKQRNSYLRIFPNMLLKNDIEEEK